jgi:lipopolysaccharide transport system permease protein
MMFWYQFIPEVRIILLPLFILIAFAASMAGGLWIAALNV